MKFYSNLVKKVLSQREPDPSKWEQWTQPNQLAPVSESACIQTFVSMCEEIKHNHEKVLVAGDYDCDGILATTIMVKGLRSFGIECGFYLPDRIVEGYGLSKATVQSAHSKGYSMIITVDNGVTAFEALQQAHEYGIKTIVTDHHKIDREVLCDCLVHPSKMEETFFSLCGAGVAYECIRALGLDTDYLLELAAVAGIGDVMIVKGQTRAHIQQGLALLEKNRETHICSLLDSGIINEENIAFQVVPKLNAVGRLSNLANVNNVVRYFLSEDYREISSYKNQIVNINNQRKQLSQEMVNFAQSKIKEHDPLIVIADASFHEGIIGLVAGSVCNQYQKPAIIMCKNRDGYKASMRSVNGFDCMEFLKEYPHFVQLGGHAQAAGFFLNLQDYESFIEYLKERIRTYQWEPEVYSSISVKAEELTVEEIKSLDLLRPFGPGFEKPLFE
ncbi:MAG: DHH family phosphoesterase, partial [Erysipelotrichaceae bacterium]|nr:DHH family phosphoesterase [Erysipelotrichaceae bacterium]